MGNLNTLGLEAVAHQSPDVLFTNLVAAITTIQEKGIGESVTANPEITKLLTNATNLDVQVMIASGNMSWDTFNAYATIPKLGKNHVLKVNSTRGEGDDEHALRLLANSKDGFLVYDATGFEFLSDQFASRFGNGTYLITALDKMHRRVGSDIYRSKSSFYTMQIVRTLTTIYGVSILSLLFPFTALIGIIMLINSSPHYSTYDHPLDRANRIRRDMISETKNSKLSKSKIKELQANVAMIDDVIRAMSKNDTVVQLLHRVFSPATRKQLKLKQGQQAIEKLLMSDLNLTATRFSTL